MEEQILEYIKDHINCDMIEIADHFNICLRDCHYYLTELKNKKLVRLVWIRPFNTGYQAI